MIDGVANTNAIPVLERLIQFAGQRQRLIAHNIANIDTPDFQPVDVSVVSFQQQLRDAIDDRRDRNGAGHGQLNLQDSSQVEFTPQGLELHPETTGDNILYHDRNDRDTERIMQDMVENFMAFRTATQLLRNRYAILNTAIRERV